MPDDNGRPKSPWYNTAAIAGLVWSILLAVIGLAIWGGVMQERLQTQCAEIEDVQKKQDVIGTIEQRITRIETNVDWLVQEQRKR